MEDAKEKKVEDLMYSYTTDHTKFEEENRLLKETVNQLKQELDKFKQAPLMICEVTDIFEKNVIIKIPNGNSFFVNISDGCEKLKSGDFVLVDQKNLTVIKKITASKGFNVEKYVIIEKPKVSWKDIGGLEDQINEIREVVELPLKKPGLFKKVGIQPPKGILLYGEPGTGKTLLAKAVATATHATFIEVVGSELVQKFIGEGARLVKEMFELAKNKAPSIIFIDEIDALASKRMDIGTSGEREVNRTFMQLLAEIDGFKHLGDVKIIGCTNRKDILDPALIRPGRLDRLIKIPIPNKFGILKIFKIHTRKMNLKKMNVDRIIKGMVGFSGAEIKATCTEAGYFAIRENRTWVKEEDLLEGIKKVKQIEKTEEEYRIMFG